MGQVNSEIHDDSESAPAFLPEIVVVSRRTFLSRLKNRSFESWEEFVENLPIAAPQGTSETIVKLDPRDICSWVATFLIEVCIWGLVVYFANQSILIGLLLSATYGVFLWLCVERWLPRQMAGMLWPNLPVAVAAVGALFLLLVDKDISSLGAFFFCILPALLATLYLMKRLPEDPDRATLVSDLFLEIWAATIALRLILNGERSFSSMSYFDFGSLTALGSISVILAVILHETSRVPWASIELVTWTLNVGALGLAIGTSGLLATTSIEHPDLERYGWLPYSCINALIGLLGFKLQRSLPVLMSAMALAVVSVRVSLFVSDVMESTVAGICCFGLLGFAVIALTQSFSRSDFAKREMYH